MKKSEFKQFLKEEVKASLGGAAPQQVNEMAAIKGDIKDINPVIEGGKGAGWEVTDFNDKVVRYHA